MHTATKDTLANRIVAIELRLLYLTLSDEDRARLEAWLADLKAELANADV